MAARLFTQLACTCRAGIGSSSNNRERERLESEDLGNQARRKADGPGGYPSVIDRTTALSWISVVVCAFFMWATVSFHTQFRHTAFPRYWSFSSEIFSTLKSWYLYRCLETPSPFCSYGSWSWFPLVHMSYAEIFPYDDQ